MAIFFKRAALRLAEAPQGGVLEASEALKSLGRVLGPLVGTAVFVSSPSLPSLLATASMALTLLCGRLTAVRGAGQD